MNALSGIDRVWSGARAVREHKEAPQPRVRHLTPGGRIGTVTSSVPPDAEASGDDVVDTPSRGGDRDR
ncbi:hypothetical protein [Streptomyces sp. NPDC102360]|uniref:hypothetical protein n=1 Tax=Streptomyces sp. NPDC102360 TaxID=3366160 RepID=UPI00382313BA